MYTAFFVSDGQIAGVVAHNSSGETRGNPECSRKESLVGNERF